MKAGFFSETYTAAARYVSSFKERKKKRKIERGEEQREGNGMTRIFFFFFKIDGCLCPCCRGFALLLWAALLINKY